MPPELNAPIQAKRSSGAIALFDDRHHFGEQRLAECVPVPLADARIARRRAARQDLRRAVNRAA
jgi:hypothetical protein